MEHPVYLGVLHDYRAYKTLLREIVLSSHAQEPVQQVYRPRTENRSDKLRPEYMQIAELFREVLGMQTWAYEDMSYTKGKYDLPYPTFDQENLDLIDKLPSFKLRAPKGFWSWVGNFIAMPILNSLEWLEKGYYWALMPLAKLLEKVCMAIYRVWKSHSPVQALLSAVIPEKPPRAIAAAKVPPAQISE